MTVRSPGHDVAPSPGEAPAPAAPPSRWRRWLKEGAFLLVLILAISWWQARNLLPTGALPPEVAFVTLDGERRTLSDLQGEAALLQFWATWCGVCKRDVGGLNAVAARPPGNARVIGIALLDAPPAEIAETVERWGMRYEIWLAERSALEAYAVRAFPTTYVVDRQGRIRGRAVGMTTRWTLRWRLWWAQR